MQEPKGTGEQDADASMEAMERDLEPESVDSSGASPEAMEQEMGTSETNGAAAESRAGAASEETGFTDGKEDAGFSDGDLAKKGTMFDRWAAKSAGRGADAGGENGETARSAFPEDRGAKHTPPFPEPGQNAKSKGKQEGFGISEPIRVSGTGKKPETGEKAGADSQGNPTERFSGKGKRNRRTGGESDV